MFRRLAGVNADVVEHVSIERTESSREFHSSSLIKKPPGDTRCPRRTGTERTLPSARRRPKSVRGGSLCWLEFWLQLGLGRPSVSQTSSAVAETSMDPYEDGGGCGIKLLGRRNRAAAAGRINENTDVRASDALDDAFTDVRRAFLCVPEVVKARNAVGKKAQVSRQKPETDFPRFFPSSVAILHGNDLLLIIIRERPAYGLQRSP